MQVRTGSIVNFPIFHKDTWFSELSLLMKKEFLIAFYEILQNKAQLSLAVSDRYSVRLNACNIYLYTRKAFDLTKALEGYYFIEEINQQFSLIQVKKQQLSFLEIHDQSYLHETIVSIKGKKTIAANCLLVRSMIDEEYIALMDIIKKNPSHENIKCEHTFLSLIDCENIGLFDQEGNVDQAVCEAFSIKIDLSRVNARIRQLKTNLLCDRDKILIEAAISTAHILLKESITFDDVLNNIDELSDTERDVVHLDYIKLSNEIPDRILSCFDKIELDKKSPYSPTDFFEEEIFLVLFECDYPVLFKLFITKEALAIQESIRTETVDEETISSVIFESFLHRYKYYIEKLAAERKNLECGEFISILKGIAFQPKIAQENEEILEQIDALYSQIIYLNKRLFCIVNKEALFNACNANAESNSDFGKKLRLSKILSERRKKLDNLIGERQDFGVEAFAKYEARLVELKQDSIVLHGIILSMQNCATPNPAVFPYLISLLNNDEYADVNENINLLIERQLNLIQKTIINEIAKYNEGEYREAIPNDVGLKLFSLRQVFSSEQSWIEKSMCCFKENMYFNPCIISLSQLLITQSKRKAIAILNASKNANEYKQFIHQISSLNLDLSLNECINEYGQGLNFDDPCVMEVIKMSSCVSVFMVDQQKKSVGGFF